MTPESPLPPGEIRCGEHPPASPGETKSLIDLILGGPQEFEPEPPPFLASEDFPHRSYAVIYRLISVWRCPSRNALLKLSGYSDRQIYRALVHLLGRRFVRKIGRIDSEIYVLGTTKPEDSVPLIVRGHPFYSTPRGRFSKSDLTTTKNFKVSEHAYWTAETAAWIHSTMVSEGLQSVVYPEAILRNYFGYFSPTATDGGSSRRWYSTTVPDAVFMQGRASFRLEVQLSKAHRDNYLAIGKDPSHPLRILYVTRTDSIFKAIQRISKQAPRISVLKLHDTKGLMMWLDEHAASVVKEGPRPDPSREHYTSTEFCELMGQ